MSWLEAALAYDEDRLGVLPWKRNGEGKIKKPERASWKHWLTQPQTEEEVRTLFRDGALGIGLILYPASPFLVLDFDGEHAAAAWDMSGLKLVGSARVTTQSGGSHFYFRAPADTTALD